MESKWIPAARCEEFSPELFTHRWNADYTMFQAEPLRWRADDGRDSYAAYQADDAVDCGD